MRAGATKNTPHMKTVATIHIPLWFVAVAIVLASSLSPSSACITRDCCCWDVNCVSTFAVVSDGAPVTRYMWCYSLPRDLQRFTAFTTRPGRITERSHQHRFRPSRCKPPYPAGRIRRDPHADGLLNTSNPLRSPQRHLVTCPTASAARNGTLQRFRPPLQAATAP